MIVLYTESRIHYCGRRPGVFSGSVHDHLHLHSHQFAVPITTTRATTVAIQ
jgi:hypothetical protein